MLASLCSVGDYGAIERTSAQEITRSPNGCENYSEFLKYTKIFAASHHEEVVRIIAEGSGSQFDPVLVGVFVSAAKRFR